MNPSYLIKKPYHYLDIDKINLFWGLNLSGDKFSLFLKSTSLTSNTGSYKTDIFLVSKIFKIGIMKRMFI